MREVLFSSLDTFIIVNQTSIQNLEVYVVKLDHQKLSLYFEVLITTNLENIKLSYMY